MEWNGDGLGGNELEWNSVQGDNYMRDIISSSFLRFKESWWKWKIIRTHQIIVHIISNDHFFPKKLSNVDFCCFGAEGTLSLDNT